MPVDKASLQALKNILTEIDLLVSTSPQPMPARPSAILSQIALLVSLN